MGQQRVREDEQDEEHERENRQHPRDQQLDEAEIRSAEEADPEAVDGRETRLREREPGQP